MQGQGGDRAAVQRATIPRWEELMDPTDILIWHVIGAIAGWLASHLIKGGGYWPLARFTKSAPRSPPLLLNDRDIRG